MLAAYKQHMPSRLAAAETRSLELESVVTTTPIFFPKLFFRNIELVSEFRVHVIHTLDLGVSSDPLAASEYTSDTIQMPDQVISPTPETSTTQKVWDYILLPGELLIINLETIIDNNLDKHTIELTNNGIVESIIQCWFEGMIDTTIALTQPTMVVI